MFFRLSLTKVTLPPIRGEHLGWLQGMVLVPVPLGLAEVVPWCKGR
jgi:hypothetical protein